MASSIKNKVMFFPALWAGKLLMAYYKIRRDERTDKPGMGAMILCDDFLKYIRKPALTVAASGTNGKSTVTSMVTDILRLQGKKVAYNDWGANHHAGHARCLLDAVNVFNRSTKDAAVVEMDEFISPINMPKIRPQYLIVTNVGRDSMLTNGHPDFIRERMERAGDAAPGTVYVVNADNPLCHDIGRNNRRITYGVADMGLDPFPSLTDDFPVCPVCGAKPVFRYANWRDMGDWFCPGCGYCRPEADYFVESVDYENSTMTVREPEGTFTYPVNSLLIHNIYNYVSIVAMFRDMGVSPGELAACLKQVSPPASRETSTRIGEISLYSRLCKGQNVSASSRVFETVAKAPGSKEVILMLDEFYDGDPTQSETIAWIFDTDYEYLNDPGIKKIIVGGQRYLDHKVRLLMAGVDPEKIVCVQDYRQTPDYVTTEGIDAIYVLHDVHFITRGQSVKEKIRQDLLATGRKEEQA